MRVAFLVVFALAAVALLVYRASYHNWPWDGRAARVGYCDREYNRGVADDHVPAGYRTVRRVPPVVGTKLLAPRKRSDTCPTVLFMKVGDARYLSYELSGGP